MFFIRNVLFLFVSVTLFAQVQPVEVVPSSVVQIINGKSYFFHPVRQGQTLFSISRAYGVTQEMILEENPDLVYGLRFDQVIRIPAFAHTVQPGETWFGLSRNYGLEVSRLQAFNQDVVEQGLKAGQQIFLPGRSPHQKTPAAVGRETPVAARPVTPRDGLTDMPSDHTLTEPTSLPPVDSLYLLPERVYPAVAVPCRHAEPTAYYNVALLIPLFLDDIPKQLMGGDTIMAGDTRDPAEWLTLRHRSFSFLPYYHGVLIALDSIRNQGVDIRLHVFDVCQNELKARQAVSSHGFSEMDLIIGPFFSETLRYVANFALHHQIPLVSPLLADQQQLHGFPNVFKATTSLESQLEKVAAFVAREHSGNNIIFVHNNQPQALPVINSFKKRLREELLNEKGQRSRPLAGGLFRRDITSSSASETDTVHSALFKEVIFVRDGMQGLLKAMDQEKTNTIITLISGEAFLSNYMRELNIHADNYDIVLFGIPDWKDYQSLEIDYLLNLNVHIFSSEFENYTASHTRDFIRKYRLAFQTEPPLDAFKGVHTAYYFFGALALYGKTFPQCMDEYNAVDKRPPIYYIRPLGEAHGWANQYSTIFTFRDFRMIDVNAPEF